MAKTARKRKVDFTGVESFNKPAEGTHNAKVKKVEETTSQGGNDMFKVTFEVTAGPSKGCRVIENYPLIDTALWKLKSLLQAVGMKAEGRVQIDLDKLEGKALEIDVYYEEYNGQDRAKISETRKLSAEPDEDDDDDFEEDNDEEEKKPAKKNGTKKSAKSSKKSEPEPEEEDDDWDDDDWDDED